MFGAFQIGRAYGIPIRLHWTMFLFLPYLALEISGGLAMPLGWGWAAVLLLFLSVALHEFGHALVARGRGYPVRDIVLTPIGGVAFLLRAPGKPRDELLIAIAGPVVSLVLALTCGAAMALALSGRAADLATLQDQLPPFSAKAARATIAAELGRPPGVARVQAWGGPVRELHAGDVCFFAPDEKHWHGAAPNHFMVHLAMQEAVNGEHVTWLEHVTDEQYAVAPTA